MKIIDNKEGFTLIELLAVIVVLAIVAVIGYSTVLPLLADSRRGTFATEANHVLDAAQSAMTLVQIDKADMSYVHSKSAENGATKYCFTLEDLNNLQVLKKSLTDTQGKVLYQGIVEVTVPKGAGKFVYYISMQNESYSVSTDKGNVDAKIVFDKSEKTAATTCEGYSN